jgi:tetratricopeptide (TPR) repeat protein
MTRRYPDDDEVWIYYALALQASAPRNDKSYASQRRSADILERQFARNPQHPGAAHYLIHAYDYPPLAERGLAAARKYASIAPAAPHARHMPSHVFSMLGLWEDSIKSNAEALALQSDYYHAADFTVYAHLQLAQDQKARAMMDRALAETRIKPPGPATGQHGPVSMPVRFVLERADWAGAAVLPVAASDWPFAPVITRLARGLGMARTGDLAGARREIDAMKASKQDLLKINQTYWAARTDEFIYAVSAWLALADGQRELAERLLRAAADSEDASVKHVAMENRLYPMREMLADLLRELDRPAEALREYEAALLENPNRYRALYGAALAAQSAGDRERAAGYFERVVALSAQADTARPELTRASGFLARR